MRSRCLLHKNKMDEFASWLLAGGWASEAPKGAYEVMRMRHPDQEHPLLVYERNSGDHLTTHGVALDMANRFIEDKKVIDESSKF